MMIITESKGFNQWKKKQKKTNFFLGDTDGGVIHATRQRFSMTLPGTEIIIITPYM
jgi:hypothetical protein